MSNSSIDPIPRKLSSQDAASRELPPRELPLHEPIAVIGMGCRLPGGVNKPGDFWELLANGREALGPIPEERWDIDAFYHPEKEVPGKIYVDQGCYLEQIDHFDPSFFKISPREAISLDPQQRLALEVAWEALEDAAIAPDSIKGTDTGIFIGQFWDDYSMQRIFGTQATEIDRYAQLSALRGLSAGRIAHLLDVHGPTMQVDTACSSALLAVHLACQALRNREAALALAGGVSLVLSPEHLIGVSQMQALAPDGRCKTFDAAADGFGQGEGCGIVVLKRLADAEKDKDHILAVIRGSAVNHDGHSRTVTTPNGPAQRAMLQQALDNAGIDPHHVGYVEAHGTGTSLGDPIEFMALARILCHERENPLYIGSVKTNIGHLDAAAGIAGLMKVVLSLQQGAIPPSLHFNQPNPRIPWDDWPIQVPTELVPWTSSQRMAGVSAFGMSGTNVHLLLENFQIPPKRSTPKAAIEKDGYCVHLPSHASQGSSAEIERPHHILPLSARDEETLQNLTRAYLNHLTRTLGDIDTGDHVATAEHQSINPSGELQPNGDVQYLADDFPNICYTAATGRNHFEHRLAIIAPTMAAALSELTQFVETGSSRWSFTKESQIKRPKTAFLFTGQGAQYSGMGQQLYDTQPTFRFWLDQCAERLDDYLEIPLLDLLWLEENEQADPHSKRIDQTAYTQPALFAIEYALAQLWLSWGVEPDVVMGHSVGEYVAACVAGVFSLDDGLMLIAARGRLMQSLPTGGGMVSVLAAEATVVQTIAPYEGEVTIAAVNGPTSIVISGIESTLQKIQTEFEAQGIKAKQLTVSHAFHSPLMDPILDDFAQVADQVTYQEPTLPIISNVSGKRVGKAHESGELVTPQYWVQHLREAVRFADGMSALQAMKINTFVEIGPKPTLLSMGRGCLPDLVDGWYPSLRPDAEWETLLASVAQLYTRGVAINWNGFEEDYRDRRHKVPLPTYPWRRQRYWLDVVAPSTMGSPLHPLLHSRIASPIKQIIFESRLSAKQPAYLIDHKAYDNVLLPASAYVEMVSAAGTELLGTDPLQISDLSLQKALMMTGDLCVVQLILTPEEGGYEFGMFSQTSRYRINSNLDGQIGKRPKAGAESINQEWICHATGKLTLRDNQTTETPSFTALNLLKERYTEEISIAAFEERFVERGMAYGPAFQALEQFYQSPTDSNAALAHVLLPAAAHVPGDADGYQIHPVLLDACFRVSEALFATENEDALYLPIGIRTLTYEASRPSSRLDSLWVQATGAEVGVSRIVDMHIMDEEGASIATIEGLTLRAAPLAALQRQSESQNAANYLTDWLYQLAWRPKPIPKEPATTEESVGTYLVIADKWAWAAQLVELLGQKQRPYLLVSAGSEGSTYQRLGEYHYQLDPASAADYDRLLNDATVGPLAGVIHMAALSVQEGEHHWGAVSVLHLVQALLRNQRIAPLWLVTSGTQSIEAVSSNTQSQAQSHTQSRTEEPQPLSPWQSSIWGLGRVIREEHPELSCISIDLEHRNPQVQGVDEVFPDKGGNSDGLNIDPAPDVLSLFLQEIHTRDDEPQVAFRQGKRYVARLVSANLEADYSPVEIHPDASYLITGGLGALGLEMAQFLVDAGAKHLLLTGRTGVRSTNQREAIQQLEANGTMVHVIRADVAIEDDVKQLLAQAQRPIRGIIHAAGVLDDGMVMQQNPERFAKVAAPKVHGAWNLHCQTQKLELDFFVLFSSVASLMGSTGQANYATANAFMDGLAHYRRGLGLPALAINWGPWGDVGMATSEQVQRRLANEGWGTISSQQGWQITQMLLQNRVTQAGALPIDWTTFIQKVPDAGSAPFLAEITANLPNSRFNSEPSTNAYVQRVKNANSEERQAALVSYLQERIAQTLRISSAQIDEHQPLNNLGIDSLTSVELRNWVRSDLDIDLPLDRFLTTPTIGALADLLGKHVLEGQESASQLSPEVPEVGGEEATDGAAPMMERVNEGLWVTFPEPRPGATMRLFCFPYAGGGASAYREWANNLPPEIELCPIQYPGREERLQEPLITDLSYLVSTLLPALQPYLDKPFAFFGHSMGAVIAYETARQLETHRGVQPIHLFISSRQAPQLVVDSSPLRHLPDGELIEHLQTLYDAVPELIRNNQELQKLFLPVLRADVALLETHPYVPSRPLDFPITVYGGKQDQSINQELLTAWREQTSSVFDLQMFSGGHFYLEKQRKELVGEVVRKLSY
ncbi:MAG: SDR family NAD(P)-dependent oxidoreductase [Chloroflexota bacterium]